MVRFLTIMKLDSLANSLGKFFSLKQILFGTFDTTSLNLSMNKTEERVLMMAWHRGGASMTFLSREAGLEKGSLTAVVDSLESYGLVSRERDGRDSRSFIVTATPSGARLAEKIEELFREHLEVLLDKLPREDRLEFIKAAETFARLIPTLAS